MAINLGY